MIKYERNGLNVWDVMQKNAADDIFPNSDDTFRYKFYGLFHVKPSQDSFILRCRIPGGVAYVNEMKSSKSYCRDVY